ncbi:MAG: hypothetical protein JFAIHJKO_00113 [Pyrinomonadaceae bacterium]|nr:hypothetical protein [Pyrinomonadaceae bacterium]
MELVRTASSNDVDLAAAASTGFSRIERAKHLEFADRINARIGLDRQIRTTVRDIRTVNRKGILAAASTVDRDLNNIRLAVRVRRSDVNLIGKIR